MDRINTFYSVGILDYSDFACINTSYIHDAYRFFGKFSRAFNFAYSNIFNRLIDNYIIDELLSSNLAVGAFFLGIVLVPSVSIVAGSIAIVAATVREGLSSEK